ncbi:MAG: RNA polymerase sigma factor, partial [Actinomycetota bacterium]|nr:RNA polymerase sigma factor [Actinomycetota bacterium]
MEGLAELAFRRHHAQIYRYLRRKTGDADRAEDLAQEVFADAASALARGDWRPASMLAWLYTIAQRRFADEVRRRRHSYNGVPLDDLLDDVPAPDY